jgi:cytochrome b subunit of formate dehydrogenase
MDKTHKYLRFSLSDRVEHWVLTLSFTALAITGLAQRYVDSSLARWTVGILGGIEAVRLLHHIAAVALMLGAIYHFGVVGYRIFVLRIPMSMLPGMRDMRNAVLSLRYNLGLSQARSQQGRYTFEEKLEYWAVVWGTLVMGVTGFMLWNPIATTHLLPGDFIPAAKAAHGNEALLAVLAVIVWHVYHVHLRHFNKSIFIGYLTEEEMLDEHPQELADLKAGRIKPRPGAETLARRQKIFLPVYGVLAAVMLVGVYFFVGFEKTAIATVPSAEQVVVFAPLTPTPLPTIPPTPTPTLVPPTDTPAPGTSAETPAVKPPLSWQGGIADLIQNRCVTCHSNTTKLGGLDLSSYQTALAGGISGPAIVPSESRTSLLITRQASGDHPGQFTEDELEQMIHWIEAGALEK